MEPTQLLMTKTGIVAQHIARGLTTSAVGDRVPNVQALAKKHGVGNGTVQSALGLLEDAGAIEIRARGRLGSRLESIDQSLLWQLSGTDSLSIALPLPYSTRYEGLATGLQEGFGSVGVPLTLMFVRGSVPRARAVEEGRADLAVMSRFAASTQPELTVVHDFGTHSYVGAHGLVVTKGADPTDSALRVAVDASSADQVAMTRAHFGELPPERLVDVSYNQLGRCFATGAVEATIWNLDEIDAHIGVPIDVHPVDDFTTGPTTAAVVVARGDQPVATAVRQALSSETVTAVAEAVVAGDRLPTY